LLRTQGFPPDRQGDVDEALKRLREKLDDCSDCAGNQKEKLRKLLDDPGTILKFDANLKLCGQTGPMTVTGLNKTFAIGPKAWNCCRNPIDPIDSLASTIGHELVHFRNLFNGEDEAFDFEVKCFGCF
jgi:hypothetical protein